MKRLINLLVIVVLLLTLNANGLTGAAQSTIPELEQIKAFLQAHPLLRESGARVIEVFRQGEALVINLSQEILPGGQYDPMVFNRLQDDLDQTFHINQYFLTTFKVESQTLEHWGQSLPEFRFPEEPPQMMELPGEGALKGVRIALSPGHGLYWNEFYGDWRYQRLEFWGIREDTLNAEIMRYVGAALLNQGATVIQTRELDLSARIGITGFPAWHEGARQFAIASGLPSSIWNGGSNNYNSDIRTRPYIANYYGADILISLHNNGWDGTLSGTETYYDTNNHPGSPVLATYVHNEIIQTIRSEYEPSWINRGIKSSDDNYGEINYAQMPAILIELAFMDNYHDNQALHSESFKILAAEAITRGICRFWGTPCEDVRITLPITVEVPDLSPAFGAGMCDSGWYRYLNVRDKYAFLALNAQNQAHAANLASWQPELPISGEYRLEAFIPAHGEIAWKCPNQTVPSDTGQATYEIAHANGTSTRTVNQAASAGSWVDLGIYHFNDETQARVTLRDLTLERQDSRTVSASAMRFTLVGRAGTQFHNTEWVPATWYKDQLAISSDRIRNFLIFHASCLADPVLDTDGEWVNIPEAIHDTAIENGINPTLLLAIMEAESGALSSCPDSSGLRALMGLETPQTASEQIAAAGAKLRTALDALAADVETPNGWAVGVPKTTLDGVQVVPANETIALILDYTQHAGSVWGGDQPGESGAYGIYTAWRDYHLEKLLFTQLYKFYLPVMPKQGW